MEGLAVEDLNIDEERYQAWKAERETQRAAKKLPEETAVDRAPHIPLNPQEIIANRLAGEARTIAHVSAVSTEDVFAHIDELLRAS